MDRFATTCSRLALEYIVLLLISLTLLAIIHPLAVWRRVEGTLCLGALFVCGLICVQVLPVEQLQKERYKLQTQDYKYFLGDRVLCGLFVLQ